VDAPAGEGLSFTILEDEAVAPYVDALKEEEGSAAVPEAAMEEEAGGAAAPAEGGEAAAEGGAAPADGAAPAEGEGGDDAAPMET
jgi:hypothetical protein